MEYDYSVYYRQNCILPILFSSFCLILLTVFVVSVCKKLSAHEPLDILQSVLILVTFLLLTTLNLTPLFRGGFWLLFEKENDAVTITGTVEETDEIRFAGAKYGVENNNGFGETLVVDGVKYYLMTYGDTEVGDTVTLKVLPRSRIVLGLYGSDQNSEPSE